MNTGAEVITVVVDETNAAFRRNTSPDMSIELVSTDGEIVRIAVPNTHPGVLEKVIATLKEFKRKIDAPPRQSP